MEKREQTGAASLTSVPPLLCMHFATHVIGAQSPGQDVVRGLRTPGLTRSGGPLLRRQREGQVGPGSLPVSDGKYEYDGCPFNFNVLANDLVRVYVYLCGLVRWLYVGGSGIE